jgi:hypothetical protein
MATGTVQPTTLPPPPPAPPVTSESVEHERIIQRKLRATSLHVRLVDLASSIAVWLIGVLVLFIVVAIADHLVGLGTVGRCVALAALLVASVWFVAVQIVPLLVRTINPAFAARTIEEATPTLKNSLINFLLLRQDRSHLREIVYQAVERQAATDISVVPVEMTVDRSRLIHAGYALCVVMAIFAAYKVLSPKDPFQSVARVLVPWAEIARPSRVQISDVQPGSIEIYYGQTVPISATVRGVRAGDVVRLRFSTADGQSIDQPVEMRLSAGDRYECQLPPPDPSALAVGGGVQQDVKYRIAAGDAESISYRLTVVSAPTIIVERLEYQYPAYTKKAAESVAQQGDIKALEGTKVTIHAIANQRIKAASIDFDPLAKEAPADSTPLAADGERGRGTVTLLLRPDRQTPWHTTYQVRYYNERGQRSERPILHKIEVLRDLTPEVQILKPDRLRVEVPEDGELPLEIRAVDPDFGLAGLRIEGTAAGKPPVNVSLLADSAEQPPQITIPYAFRPREHQLSAGDELQYVAVAEDNRSNPQTGQPEPNVARTKEYTLVVLPPMKNDRNQQGQKQPAQGGKNADETKPNQPPQTGKQGPDKNSPQRAQNQDQPPQGDPKNSQPMPDGGQQKPEQGDKQQPDQKQPNNQPQKDQQGSGDSKPGNNQQQSGGQQGAGQQNSGQQNGENQQGGQAGDSQQNNSQGSSQQSGSSGSKGASSSQPSNSSGGGQPGDKAGQGGKSGQSAGNSQQPADGQPGERPPEATDDPSGRGEGKNSGKAHDGRAIEEVLKDLEQRGEQPKSGGQSRSGQGATKPMSGAQPQSQPEQESQEKTGQGAKAGSEQGGQPQSGGKSGAEGQNTPSAGKAEGTDQQPGANDPKEHGEAKSGEKADRLPDEKQGKNPAAQKSGGNEGGASQGPSKTDQGQKSSPSQGEQRDAGAGKTGQEGAGRASQDKSGSGEATGKNLDRDKQMKADGNRPDKGDASPASGSKRQSDSKGGDSGSESGGGKQGAGQSGGQEGNDSAGGKSAGDQGAGQANETGSGNTGSKAGQQQKAAGKTGQSGNETGDGSTSRPGDEGSASGSKAGQPGQGEAGQAQHKGVPHEKGKAGETSSQSEGGADDGSIRQPKSVAEQEQADAANLEYARRATDMVLKKLKDEEHNPDPELLDKLGWTREDLAEFLRRWESLQKSAGDSPTGKRDLDEALKSLGLRDPANRRRTGGKASDNQRDLRDAGNRSAPPARYRDLFDAFRKGAARSTP